MAVISPHDDASRVAAGDDKFHEECGVFGVWNVPDAAAVTALGLHALQHRGQESTGIVSFDGRHFHSHRGLGLVGDNFGDARVIASLPGPTAIGHNRYATTGDTILRNVQPLYADFEFGGFAVAHNGNLTNAHVLRRDAGAARLPVPVHHRLRGVRPPDRDQPVFHRGRSADRRAEAGDRRLFAGRAVHRGADGRARPARRAPADPRPHRQRRHRRLGAGLARPARSTSSAPTSCATWSRARSW